MFSSSNVLSFIGRGTPLTKRASAHLDMIRGVAALAVLLSHIRGFFYLDYKDVTQHRGAVLSLLYAITNLGHQAVMVFFVLSGFLIGGSVLTSLKRWNWQRYLVNRFCRLYLVLLPALLLTAVLDHFARQQSGGHIYFDLPIAHFNTQPIAERETLRVFLGNAVFLQTIVVPTFGSDSPLWSLANEFWYYLLFPSMLVAIFSAERPWRRACGVLVSVVLLVWLPAGFLIGFAIWLAGAAIHLLPPLRAGRRLLWTLHALFGGIFAIALMLSRVQRIPAAWSDPTIGVAFALWLSLLVKAKTAPTEISHTYGGCARFLSKCSYSVYAVHFPIVLLVRASVGVWLWEPTLRNLALGLLLSTGVFFCGWVFSRFTEARTDSVRAAVMRLVSRPLQARQTAA